MNWRMLALRAGVGGARGGARGHNPYPARENCTRFKAGWIHSGNTPRVTQFPRERPKVNDQPQPWQIHAAKLAKRKRMDWDQRKRDRDYRNTVGRVNQSRPVTFFKPEIW